MAHLALFIASAAIARGPQARPLGDELKSIAATTSGTLGIAVLHVESGTGATLHADEWFPMMSVYKLPIAIHALRLADRGKLDLSRVVTLGSEDRRPGLSPLARTIEEKGPQKRSVRELISAMLRISDNTASDALLRLAGGPQAVGNTLRELGIAGIDVSRYELEFAADYFGVCCAHEATPFSLERFADAVEHVSPDDRRRAAAAYLADRRDSARPDAMATLLARLTRGELLDADDTAWVTGEMASMHGRDTRLRAGLPAGTLVALRPGTSGETESVRAAQNDNAIVTLPDGRGHLVIAAFLKGARGTDAQRDATLAQVARVAYAWAMAR